MVHVHRPSGGVEQASLMSWASARPSKIGGVGGVVRFLGSRAASQPSSTNRSRIFATVLG